MIDGHKTYIVAGVTALFALFCLWNNFQLHGYVPADAIEYVGGLLAGAGALVAGRSAIKKLEK